MRLAKGRGFSRVGIWTSGYSCGLRCRAALGVQIKQTLAKRPVRILSVASKEPGHVTLTGIAGFSDFGLRHACVDQVLNYVWPVHGQNHKRKCACFASGSALELSSTIAL